MSNDRERVYLDLHKNFVREGLPGSDGRTFNSVTIPAGVTVDGADIGGYKFFPLYVNESTRSENWRTIPLLLDRDVQLGRPHLDKDGNPKLDEHGERIVDVAYVDPRDLVEAVDAARVAYRKEHPRDVVWVNVHKGFAAEKDHFWSIGLAPNTMIDGRDFGNYRFTVPAVHPSQYNENVLGVPLEPERSYKLGGGEHFADVAHVKGAVLKEAIETARAIYRAEREAERAHGEGRDGPGGRAGDGLASIDSEIDRAVLASEAARDDPYHNARQEVPLALGR